MKNLVIVFMALVLCRIPAQAAFPPASTQRTAIQYAEAGVSSLITSMPAFDKGIRAHRLTMSDLRADVPGYIVFLNESQARLDAVPMNGIFAVAERHLDRAIERTIRMWHAAESDMHAAYAYLPGINREIHQALRLVPQSTATGVDGAEGVVGPSPTAVVDSASPASDLIQRAHIRAGEQLLEQEFTNYTQLQQLSSYSPQSVPVLVHANLTMNDQQFPQMVNGVIYSGGSATAYHLLNGAQYEMHVFWTDLLQGQVDANSYNLALSALQQAEAIVPLM